MWHWRIVARSSPVSAAGVLTLASSIWAGCNSQPPSGLANDVRLVPVTTEPVDATSTPAPKDDAAPASPRVKVECFGDNLDLSQLNGSQKCARPKKCALDEGDCSLIEHSPRPAELGVAIVPEVVRASRGADIRFRVELENLTGRALLMDVDSTCGIAWSFSAQLSTAGGTRATYVGVDGQVTSTPPPGCEGRGNMFGCETEAMRIELAPKGKAFVKLQIEGKLPGRVGRRCESVPLPTGTYLLKVRSPFEQGAEPRAASATVEIE